MILDKINQPSDVKGLSKSELETLASEIRSFLIEKVSRTGGHLSANLGVVELTLAICRCFDFPQDQIVFDVGHQAYVYKLLTGRKAGFDRLRQKNGLSGFPKIEESEADAFGTGHASTSVSAALGLAKARDLSGKCHYVAALIGDGAMTGGMVYEAMNQAGRDGTPLIVILNDNEMSIGPNVGALSRRLSEVRTRSGYLKLKKRVHSVLEPDGNEGAATRMIRNLKRRVKYFLLSGTFFEELGFTYLGPVDGCRIDEIERVLEEAKNLNEPVVVHVRTRKGKGCSYAEANPSVYHGVGPFDPKTGKTTSAHHTTWADEVGRMLVSFGSADPKMTVVCAAMPQGTGVVPFSQQFPKRFFDVGICEEHAVTFSCGLARGGMNPWFVVYSTFLQRGYDQLIHDAALQKLPVRLLLDHAGVVGEDGPTHQGTFDLAYLGHIPGVEVLAPSSADELHQMMRYAAGKSDGPVAIRYPKGTICVLENVSEPVKCGYGVFRKKRSQASVLLLALGAMTEPALKAAEQLEKEGIAVDVADARFAAPLNDVWLNSLADQYSVLITLEDHVRSGGFGQHVRDRIGDRIQVSILSLPDQFIPQGSRSELLAEYGLNEAGIAASVRSLKNDRSGSQGEEENAEA